MKQLPKTNIEKENLNVFMASFQKFTGFAIVNLEFLNHKKKFMSDATRGIIF